ncbi:hypothetical protein [Paenibacillus sp. SI8]
MGIGTLAHTLHKLLQHKPGIDISLEQLSDETVDETIQYVRNLLP